MKFVFTYYFRYNSSVENFAFQYANEWTHTSNIYKQIKKPKIYVVYRKVYTKEPNSFFVFYPHKIRVISEQ